jgi:hypothetical protein
MAGSIHGEIVTSMDCVEKAKTQPGFLPGWAVLQ